MGAPPAGERGLLNLGGCAVAVLGGREQRQTCQIRMPLEKGPGAGGPSMLGGRKGNGQDMRVGSLMVCKLEG